MDRLFYAVNEIAEMLEIDRARVYQVIKDLELDKVYIPGSRRFFVVKAEDVERIKQRRTELGRPKKNGAS